MRGSKVARRKIGSVDLDTGEVLDGVVVICGLKRNPYSGGWVMNAQEALEILAVDRDLKGETYRVLLFLLSRLDFENWIQVPQVEIALKLQMHKQDVNKAMKLLESKGIILKGPKAGRSYAFRLNPYYGWKGKVKHLDEYRQKEAEDPTQNITHKQSSPTNSNLKLIVNPSNLEIDNVSEDELDDSYFPDYEQLQKELDLAIERDGVELEDPNPNLKLLLNPLFDMVKDLDLSDEIKLELIELLENYRENFI